MGYAFEITTEDVLTVMQQLGIEGGEEKAEEFFNELDTGAVEKAALYGDDMDEQTEYAYKEIREQIAGMVVFPGHLRGSRPA